MSPPTISSCWPHQPLVLTRARTFETGVKNLFWDSKAEWSFAVFDIERKNVYSGQPAVSSSTSPGHETDGVEFAAAVRVTEGWRLWGNSRISMRAMPTTSLPAFACGQHAAERAARCRQCRHLLPPPALAGGTRHVGSSRQ